MLLDARHRFGNAVAVAVGGINDDQVTLGIQQRLSAFKARIAHGGGSGNAQAAGFILGGVGVVHRAHDVLHGDQADAVAIIIHHDQLLDAAVVQQAAAFGFGHTRAHGDETFLRHQLGDRLRVIFSKAQIAVGDDADKTAGGATGADFLHHRKARNAVARHQRAGISQRLIRGERDRVDHHAAFKALHLAHSQRLFLHGEIAVQHADAAQLRHGDRHVGFGHCVHRGGKHRDVEPYALGHPCRSIGHAGQHGGCGRHQQHVIEGKAQAGFLDPG